MDKQVVALLIPIVALAIPVASIVFYGLLRLARMRLEEARLRLGSPDKGTEAEITMLREEFGDLRRELSDVQERRQAAVNAVGLAKYRLTTAEQESARLQAETQVALEQEISAAEQDIADSERELGSSEGVLKVVRAGAMRRDVPAGEAGLAYEIVRQSAQGAIAISSLPTANLEPGDLVRVQSRLETEPGTTEARLPQ